VLVVVVVVVVLLLLLLLLLLDHPSHLFRGLPSQTPPSQRVDERLSSCPCSSRRPFCSLPPAAS